MLQLPATAVRSLLFRPAFAPPLQDWGVSTYLNRHRRDPFVSSVCFEADSPQASAQRRRLQ